MSEISASAAFLIAMSSQSIQRAKLESRELFISNSTACIVFAAFFVEASLTAIIINKEWASELYDRYKNFPGLLSKMVFFMGKYPNDFPDIPLNKKGRYDPENALTTIDSEFPGFRKLHDFRNSVCHGDLMGVKPPKFVPIPNFEKLQEMRQIAKNIVDRLIELSDLESLRTCTYSEAVSQM